MKPKVSIIMATYNRAHFIVETLYSIQNQTYLNWECLIIDDGGTDNTLEVIQPILIQDTRIIYLNRPDSYKKGLPGCRNYGLDISDGDYIIFFDDDDIVHPQNLELCVLELLKEDIQFCRYIRNVFEEKFNYQFDLTKKYTFFYINVCDIERLITHELPFNSCSVMWKKECFSENRFIETLMYAEEWELYSRILSNGFNGVSINKCLFYGRKHLNSNTGEFYNNNTIRTNSKKEAILLVTENLINKNLLSQNLLNYLAGFALSFRDKQLLNDILKIGKASFKIRPYLNVKYYLFPIWKFYKREQKKLKLIK